MRLGFVLGRFLYGSSSTLKPRCIYVYRWENYGRGNHYSFNLKLYQMFLEAEIVTFSIFRFEILILMRK